MRALERGLHLVEAGEEHLVGWGFVRCVRVER